MDVPITCICPGSPHPGGDTVVLLDALDFRTAARVRNAVALLEDDERQDTALVLAVFEEQYLLHGITSWTLVAADGQPVPVNPDTVATALLPHVAQASIVADAADNLYAVDVIAPLAARARMPSSDTQTAPQTSAPTTGQPTPTQPTPLRRSSTTTTRTDDTGAATA